MIVKCVRLFNDNADFEKIGWHNVEGHLTLSKEYVVLAISEDWYGDSIGRCVLICDDISEDDRSKFPYFVPMSFFEVVDSTPSKYWIKKGSLTAFKEFVDDHGFYYRLSEGDGQAENNFLYYRKQLYDEAGL